MRKTNMLYLIILIAPFLLTGCQYKDINRRLFITEMGIDSLESDKVIQITAKAAIPSGGTEGGGEKQDKYELFVIKAASIGDALRRLKAQSALEPSYAHLKVIILGREFADKFPMDTVIDYFMRRRDIQNIAYFAVGEPSAKDIVSYESLEGNVPGSEVFLKFGQGSQSPYRHVTNLFEMYRSIYTPGETPYCPVVRIEKEELVVDELAAFTRKYVTGCYLSPEEVKILEIINNSSALPYFFIQTPTNKPYGIEIIKSKSDIKITASSNNEINCGINIKATAMIEESAIPKPNIKNLKETFEKQLEAETFSLIAKLQDYQVDPLHLGTKYWATKPSFELNDSWPTDIFPLVNINVNADIKIISTGLIQ